MDSCWVQQLKQEELSELFTTISHSESFYFHPLETFHGTSLHFPSPDELGEAGSCGSVLLRANDKWSPILPLLPVRLSLVSWVRKALD